MILGTALGPFGLIQVSKSGFYFKLNCVLFSLKLFLEVIMLVCVFSKFVV